MTDLELQSQETEALLKTSERPKKRALAIQIIALCGAAALAGAALASRAGGSRDVVVTGLARADGVVCQLTGIIVDESCENLFNSGDTCIPVNKDAYFWWNVGFVGDGCATFTFPSEGLTVSVLSRCHQAPE